MPTFSHDSGAPHGQDRQNGRVAASSASSANIFSITPLAPVPADLQIWQFFEVA
jgi:hypothetical protein